ncbi:MAG: hypothetical protein JW966_02630 [Anaerolineae bacterium]|nr:hypothetical protein [Anaerolineae bacterium]
MTKRATNFDEAVMVVSELSALDRIRLLEKLASMLEHDLSIAGVESVEALPDSPTTKPSFAELADWLGTNPPEEPWGDINEDEDAADYVHRMRRQTTIQLDDRGDEA